MTQHVLRGNGIRMLRRIADASQWDSVVLEWPHDRSSVFLRAYSDEVNRRLLARWLPAHAGSLLKTDLFDEAVGDGLYPTLRDRATSVVGVDVSPSVVAAAHARYPTLDARVGDVRALPFDGGTFDVVVSNSTLDHFASLDDLVAGVAEVARVTAPGGRVILTLDNPVNPLVALRNALPYRLVHRAGLVPYVVGTTCGPSRLRRVLADAGLETTEISAVMHFPRIAARALGRALDGERGTRCVAALGRCEVLVGLPTRFVTGQFVAARAVRRSGARVPC
jgi:SAM-dependent methyltransferase